MHDSVMEGTSSPPKPGPELHAFPEFTQGPRPRKQSAVTPSTVSAKPRPRARAETLPAKKSAPLVREQAPPLSAEERAAKMAQDEADGRDIQAALNAKAAPKQVFKDVKKFRTEQLKEKGVPRPLGRFLTSTLVGTRVAVQSLVQGSIAKGKATVATDLQRDKRKVSFKGNAALEVSPAVVKKREEERQLNVATALAKKASVNFILKDPAMDPETLAAWKREEEPGGFSNLRSSLDVD